MKKIAHSRRKRAKLRIKKLLKIIEPIYKEVDQSYQGPRGAQDESMGWDLMEKVRKKFRKEYKGKLSPVDYKSGYSLLKPYVYTNPRTSDSIVNIMKADPTYTTRPKRYRNISKVPKRSELSKRLQEAKWKRAWKDLREGGFIITKLLDPDPNDPEFPLGQASVPTGYDTTTGDILAPTTPTNKNEGVWPLMFINPKMRNPSSRNLTLQHELIESLLSGASYGAGKSTRKFRSHVSPLIPFVDELLMRGNPEVDLSRHDVAKRELLTPQGIDWGRFGNFAKTINRLDLGGNSYDPTGYRKTQRYLPKNYLIPEKWNTTNIDEDDTDKIVPPQRIKNFYSIIKNILPNDAINALLTGYNTQDLMNIRTMFETGKTPLAKPEAP